MWTRRSWSRTARRRTRRRPTSETFGFHPLGVWCDNTEEFLSGMLRTGRAGSNTAGDHITVLHRSDRPGPRHAPPAPAGQERRRRRVHQLLDWLHEQGQVRDRSVEYSVGFAITEQIRDAIKLVPKKIWTPALDADGGVRAGGDVAEITGLIAPTVMAKWPAGMRVIVRRERPHPGAQLSLFEERDGWRYQAFVTNTTLGQLAFLEARAPGPCPGRGPDPARQGRRPGPVPVAGLRHQPGLVDADPGRS